MATPNEPLNETATLEKPPHFRMTVQGGMLEALGINMYSTLGKCLVEFIANAYDADAPEVEVTIPFNEISGARSTVREAAKAEVAAGTRKKFTLLTLPLTEGIQVVIRDTGHGMAPSDVEKKFLPFNRNRRVDEATQDETRTTSEGGKRRVMGRKGLGKLAGFGTAEVVIIKTKRAGFDYATEIRLDYEDLKKKEDLTAGRIEAKYINNLPVDEHWTEIRLDRLKCDAVKYGQDTLFDTLADNFFGIRPEDFKITLNSQPVVQKPVQYEFLYPDKLDANGFASDTVNVEDFGPIEFKYVVCFRNRGDNLPAARRGARIYCTNRLAAGPSLFALPTGMHGFHNISYMECVVQADQFDHIGLDLINTNRTQLKEDNEAVSLLLKKVAELMKAGVAAHSKYRDNVALQEVAKTTAGNGLMKIVDRMPAKTRNSAKALLMRLSSEYGAESEEFSELAPLVVDTMNAGEVLIKLIELGTDPKTIPHVANALRDLADIEKSDALKLYRGRRDGILGLILLVNRGAELWGKKGIEKELHTLLKKAPWLLRPEFGRYAASDANLENVYGRIAKELEIDVHGREDEDSGKAEELKKRPDLVHVMGPAHTPGEIVVVELKSPSIPLTLEHLNQLKYYMNRVEDWCRQHLQRPVPVKGFLVGTRAPASSTAQGPYQLRKEEEKAGSGSPWEVIGLEQLIEYAHKVHSEEIDALENDLPDESALKAVMKPKPSIPPPESGFPGA